MMKRILKKFGAVLLALCMVITMLPATTQTAWADGDVSITIGGRPITGTSGTGWMWDASTATLTLNGGYESDRIEIENTGDDVVTLVYDGKVTVASNVGDALLVRGGLEVRSNGALGDKLTLESTTTDFVSSALWLAGDASKLTLSGNIEAVSQNYYAIESNGGPITIANGAEVIAEGSNGGISANALTIKGGDVTATGDYVYGYGISADELTISGGNVTATGTGADGDGYGISAGRLTISGGNVTATGTGTGDYADGYGISADELTISGGNVTATGTGTGDYGYGYGISADELTISGGNVTATGEDYGIDAEDAFTITGGNIKARGDYSNLSGFFPQNAASHPVFETAFTGLTGDAAVIVNSPADYGVNDVKTNSNGELYIYAPVGTVRITVGEDLHETDQYGIFVGGVAVTAANKGNITGGDIKSGSVRYDSGSKTLTLDNAVIAPDVYRDYAIESSADITVALVGNNVLGVNPDVSDYIIGTGIYAQEKDIRLTGAGNLTIYDLVSGIEGENVTVGITGALTVRESGTMGACALKADKGTLTIESGTLDLLSSASNALYGGSIVINGGTITAQGLNEYKYGIFAFHNAPTFGVGYAHKVWAGNSAASAAEVASPVAATFTQSKYVKIGLLPPTPGPSPSSGGGGGAAVVTPPAEPTISGNTVTATTTATATVDNSGKATAAVTQAQVSEAITKAAEAAAKQGDGAAAVVEIKVKAPANAKTVETNIPKAAIELAADGKTAALTVSTPIASLSFDADALSTIAGEATGEVKISASIVDASTLSAETQQLIGDRPVFNFSVTSGGQMISQFGGSVSVSVPYTPKAGEDLNAIVIYYINAEGKAEVVRNCSYDPATGTISFKTDHFSQYAVGYNKVTFGDVKSSAWYSEAVSFIAAREITTGTADGTFSPNAKLTRGQFIVMLMKAYGIAPDTNSANNFADAGNTYYTGYLAAAKRLGISGGVGDNMFAPTKEITRQEMFTLLYNALEEIEQLPEGNTGKQLSAFSDAGQIASWAKDAMTMMVETGTVSGSGGKLAPGETTTRAQMAQVLYNLMSK